MGRGFKIGSRDEDGMEIGEGAAQMSFLGLRTDFGNDSRAVSGMGVFSEKQPAVSRALPAQNSNATSTTTIPLLLEGQ